MSYRDAGRERLLFLADVVMLEARYLAQTDGRLFARPLVVEDIDRLPLDADLSERVDAFVARFGRLQDTLAGALLPRLLESLLEPQGSVLDNLNRAERRGWIRSSADWAELRMLRNRMVHEYVRDRQQLVDALNAAHAGVEDLVNAAELMAAQARANV